MSVLSPPNTSMKNPGRFASPADVTAIPLVQINAVQLDARKRKLDQVAVERLKDSIRLHGVMQPIGVRATSGWRNAPYDLIYGLHRMVAVSQLADAEPDKYDANIVAVIYPAHVPDWEIELKEITENLDRLDLDANERAQHALSYAAILKRHGLVKDGTPGRPKKSTANTVDKKDEPQLTTSQAVGRLLGRSTGKTEAQRRNSDQTRAGDTVTRALKNAGLPAVSLDKATPEQLEKARDGLAEQHDAVRAKQSANRTQANVSRPVKPPMETEPPAIPRRGIIEPRATLHPMQRDNYVTLLNMWEDDWGTGAIHRIVETWWRLHYPPGRVVWQKEHGS